MFTKNSNCNIYDKSFIDDLKGHTLIDSSDGLYIDYSNTSQYVSEYKTPSSIPIFINEFAIYELIKSNLINIIDVSLYDNVWIPVFIDKYTSSAYVNQKQLSRGGSVETTRLGIENFINIREPLFENWITSPGSFTMSSDWIINSDLVPFDPKYGMMFWINLNQSVNSLLNNSSEFFDITNFPNGSRLVCNNPKIASINFIKLDNQTLKAVDEPNTLVEITSLGQNIKFCLNKQHSKNFYSVFNKSVKLWISDGEFFSYFNSDSDQIRSYSSLIPSRSYLSPCLFNTYSNIYHQFTLNRVKVAAGRSLRETRLLKKLCYLLATGPQMQTVNHNYLSDNSILMIVDSYIKSIPQDIGEEIVLLTRTAAKIYKQIMNLSIGLNNSTISNNLITSRSELYKKIISKYKSALSLTGNGNIGVLRYSKELIHGDDIYIGQSIKSYCNKNLPDNTMVYNNSQILLENCSLNTNIGEVNGIQYSEILLGNQTILPLTDCIKEPIQTADFSIGKDQIIYIDKSGEISFSITEVTNISYDRRVSYTWELEEGPCARFSDYNKDKSRQVRFFYSTEDSPTVYVYASGKYTIRCTVNTDNSSAVDTKIIYVVEKNNQGKWVYWDGSSYSTPPVIPEKIKTKLRSGNLKVACPNMTDIAFNKRGIFWPIKTDLYTGKFGGLYSDQFIRLQGNEKFVFTVDQNRVSSSGSYLILQYNPNNTTIKLQKINLQEIRNGKDDCSQCLSFYKDLLVADPPTYSRRLRSPDDIRLPRYQFIKRTSQIISLGDIQFNYPQISTEDAPNIYGYGGYSLDIKNSIGTAVPNHPVVLPSITGHKLDYPNKLCFQKEPAYKGNSVEFHKGVLHPSSGWIFESDSVNYQNVKNKSSVLKFNPGARKSFSFTGAGFDNLTSNYDALGNSVPNLFKSAISLSIDPRIVPDKPPDTNDPNIFNAWLDAQQRKELRDHDVNHGYRDLNNGLAYESDEFGYNSSVFDKTDPNCAGATASYLFSSLGPKTVQKSSPALGQLRLQDLVVPEMKIDSLEIKLNFLNYANPKDLIVWLDVDVCDFEASKILGGEDGASPRCQIGMAGGDNVSSDPACLSTSIINNIIPFNSGLANYYKDLVETNISASNRTTLRLYLLNQDHIENNCYNFSLHFSDDASPENSFNYDSLEEEIKGKQRVILPNGSVRPSTSTLGYSDRDNAKYRYILNNTKRLTNISFEKFKNLFLFKDAKGERSSSSTTFTLNIAVIDEPDSMRVYDNIDYNNVLTKVAGVENKQSSDSLYNSLCGWELILHTSSAKNFNEKDSLGLLEYGKNPRFPGYSFIADFSDKRFLLPTVNQNAPLTYIPGRSLCKFPNFESMQSLLVKAPRFPEEAILAATAAFSNSTFGLLAGGRLAAGLSILDSSPAYTLLIQWFKDVRRSQDIDEIIRNLDRSKYDNYPFGSAEKVLLNISKDNIFWYKLEATISRYFYTPLLESNKYAYVKLNKNQMPALSTFELTYVDSVDSLTDEDFLDKFVSGAVDSSTNVSNLTEGSIVKSVDGKYHLVHSAKLISFPEAYLYSSTIMNYCSFGSLAVNIFSEVSSKINNKRLIIIKDRLLYDLLEINEKIRCFNASASKDILVKNKALIIKNNIFYSVIELAESSEQFDRFSFVSPVIAVFKNRQTKIENLPIDKWGLEKTKLGASTPISSQSTIGVGSYGDGSPFVNKQLLTYNLQTNQIPSLNEILPANTIKNTNIVLSDLNNNQSHLNVNVKAYYYSINRNKDIFSSNIIPENEAFSKNIMFNVINNQEENPSICIMKLGQEIPDYGYISFENDFINKIPVSYLSQLEIDTIVDRVTLLESSSLLGSYIGKAENTDYIIANGSIEDVTKHHDSLPNDPSYCFDKNSGNKESCAKRKTKQAIYNMYYERGLLLDVLQNQTYVYDGKVYAKNNSEILTYYTTSLTKNADNSLSPSYSINGDYYWINIDPKQVCSVAEDETLKVLTKVVYTCEPVVGTILDDNADQICPQQAISTPPVGIIDDPNRVDVFFTKAGNTYEYKIPPQKILDVKNSYPGVKWREVPFTKTFFINSGGPRDTLVKSIEYYDIAVDPNPIKNDYSSIANRVYSICNLDDTSKLYVKFRNIPRKLKGIDNHYDKQVPNKDGDLVDVVNPAAGGPVYNNLTFWNCISADEFKYVPPTDYLKVQNEMIYRAFFNSVDGIEHKSAMLESLYPWEWIPYEYFIR